MRRFAPFLLFVVGFLCAICFGRPAEASRKLMSGNAERALSLLGSMSQDPDAVACVRRACLEVPYRERGLRHARLETCKQDHFRRIASVMSGNGQGPQLRPNALDRQIPSPDGLLCESIVGHAEPSEEVELDLAFLRLQEDKLAELRSGHDPETGGTGVNVPAATVKTKGAEPEVPKPAAKKRTAYSSLTGPDKSNVAHCAPEHFTVRESDGDSVKLYVDAGAAYDQLARSCFSKKYRTDAVSVVEENYVEATIPACIMPGGRIDLDPTRYSEILSRKRKLVIHGEPNLEFHKQCQAKGGKPWVALQGRQILWLAGKDKPRHVWPSQAVASSANAHSTPIGSLQTPAEPTSAAAAASPDAGSVAEPNLGAAPQMSSMPAADASIQSGPVPSEESEAGAAANPVAPVPDDGIQPGWLEESLPGGTSQPPTDGGSALRTDQAPGMSLGLLSPTDWTWTVQGIRRGTEILRATSPPDKT